MYSTDVRTADQETTRRKPKILVCISEDWFLVSHFIPLLRTLVELGRDTAVVTRVVSKRAEIEATGARIIAFDWYRGKLNPLRDSVTAGRLAALMWRERPDVVHAVAMKPIALASVVRFAGPIPRLAIHLTGVGYAGTVKDGLTAYSHHAVQWLVARQLRDARAHVFVENPDDVSQLRTRVQFPDAHATILGGAGVDLELYPETPCPDLDPPVAGFIGRLVWSKGVDVLIEAHRTLKARGVRLRLLIGGTPDPENPRSVTEAQIATWSADPDVKFIGRVSDIAGHWRKCSMAIVPSRGGEGLPRSLLESSACGRPAIVSDVPGCRYFVRHGEEGLIVPPDDPVALADAMEKLARNPAEVQRMGRLARVRVASGFTERHVQAGVRDGYARLLEGA